MGNFTIIVQYDGFNFRTAKVYTDPVFGHAKSLFFKREGNSTRAFGLWVAGGCMPALGYAWRDSKGVADGWQIMAVDPE